MKRFLMQFVLLLAAVGVLNVGWGGRSNQWYGGDPNYKEQVDKGPGTSVPKVQMTPNGDRVSPYPPYFHPDGGGGGRNR